MNFPPAPDKRPRESGGAPPQRPTRHAGSYNGSDADDNGMSRSDTTMLFHAPTSSIIGSDAPRQDATPEPEPPLRIFLIRHGQSAANVDKAVYDTTPDHAVPLTEEGRGMAYKAGASVRQWLRQNVGPKKDYAPHVRMMVSPFQRTRETADEVLQAMNDGDEQWIDSVREAPVLAEQDWGCMEGTGAIARDKYTAEMARNDIKRAHDGPFWVRLPGGESCFDVFQRASSLIADLHMAASVETPARKKVKVVILVSHGVTLRAFLSAWCRYSPEWYSKCINPPNASVQLLVDGKDCGYVFSGYERGQRVAASVLARPIDPRWEVWSARVQELNAAPSSAVRLRRTMAEMEAEEAAVN
jgi:broad specificity phosphatase PhoE